MVSVGDMLDKIVGYDKILKQFNFEKNGTGKKSWSHSHKDSNGVVIDIRNSEWTMYKNGEEIVGNIPDELHKLLLSDLSKEQLIELLIGEGIINGKKELQQKEIQGS